MLALTIASTLVGFALGFYATFRFGPTLARVPGSVTIGLIICALVGAACGLAGLYIYLAIYAFIHDPSVHVGFASSAGGQHPRSPDADIFVSAVYSIASESGVLLALAAAIFLLAPADRDSAV